MCEENPTSHSYAIRKGKSILVTFSDNCGYSLILYQNLTSGSFLKVSLTVECEAILMKFLYSTKN